MAVSSGDTITAAQFNNLQSRIAQVLGTGAGDFGYGQAVTSSQVVSLQDPNIPDGDSILASQINNIRADMDSAFTHQNGQNISTGAFSPGDIIGADESGTDLNYASNGSFVFVNEDTSKGFNDLLTIMTDLESDRLVIHPSQQEVQVRESDVRTTAWNNIITSEFTVTYSDSENKRVFFNAGGAVIIEATVDLSTSTGDSFARDDGWNDLLENPGQIVFNYNSTTVTGSTTGVTFPNGVIGSNSLGASYQVIFKKDANGGIYGNSYWQVEAREDNVSTIRFKVSLVDDGPEGTQPGITEPVTADLEVEYSARRANGSVVTSFPIFSIVDTFE